MKRIVLLLAEFCLLIGISFGQKDINQKDSLGRKQGEWILLGIDVPESGVVSGGIAESGIFINDQKIGPWKRYDKDGETVNALVYYNYDPTSGKSARIAIFPNKYYNNGQPELRHYPGKCAFKANSIRYNGDGTINEIIEMDSLGNEELIIRAMTLEEMNAMTYFQTTDAMLPSKAVTNTLFMPENTQFSGYFLVEYQHQLFQLGLFEKGKLVEGKQCLLDENMQLIDAIIITKGVAIQQLKL
jgi:hypothetical protein